MKNNIKLFIHLILNALNIAHGKVLHNLPDWDWAKNLNMSHQIEWLNEREDCFKYIYCDICKTLYVEYKWKYIWKIMFGKKK
jgi:hypothetical protein